MDTLNPRTASKAASRTGRFMVDRFAITWSWSLRLLSFGAVLGAIVGIGGQLAILATSPFLDASVEPTLWQRLIGASVTSLAYAVMGLVVGLLSAPWMASRPGRVLGISVFTVVFTLLLSASGLSTVLRILSGTHITVGALSFCLSSPDHFVRALVNGHLGSVAGGVFVASLLAGVLALRVLSLMHAPGAPRFQTVTVMAAVLLSNLGMSAGSARGALGPRVFASTAELAFARSVHHSSGLRDVAIAAGQDAVAQPELGQGRLAEKAWQKGLEESPGPRPNVLILVLESVSYRHLGYEGYRRGVTPNIDALAKGGVRARRAWATATHSNYAQMAILSSLFPRRRHYLDMYQVLNYPRLLPHDLFHRLGYATATISSQDENWQGMRRFQNTGTPTYFWHAPDHPGPHLDIGSELVVPDEITVNHAKRWLDRHKSTPWALYVNLQVTHFPYRLPDHAQRTFKPDEPTPATFSYLHYPESELERVINRYDNALAYVDRQIGRLRNHLLASGEYENTLWIITSDHGEMFHEHGMVTHGRSLFDAESRVPLIIHWPRGLKPRDVWSPVSHLDVMPTISRLIGVPSHPSYQGRDFLGAPGNPGVFMSIQGLRAVDGVVCYPWKFVYDGTGQQAFLFDLERDPGEETDLLLEQPRVAAALASLLQAQIDAQIAYHQGDPKVLREVFQPRLGTCPGWL